MNKAYLMMSVMMVMMVTAHAKDLKEQLIGKWDFSMVNRVRTDGSKDTVRIVFEFKKDGTGTGQLWNDGRLGDSEAFKYKLEKGKLIFTEVTVNGKKKGDERKSFGLKSDVLTIGREKYTRVRPKTGS